MLSSVKLSHVTEIDKHEVIDTKMAEGIIEQILVAEISIEIGVKNRQLMWRIEQIAVVYEISTVETMVRETGENPMWGSV